MVIGGGREEAALRLRGERVGRLVAVGVLSVIVVVELAVAILHPLGSLRHWGGDYTLYMDATRRWLAGGPFYQPWQFEPYVISFVPGDIGTTAILYPPYALALFVPFTVLPAVLWWAVPLAVIGYCLWPLSGWRLVAFLAALVFPVTWFIVANGNPALWAAAFMVAGTRWGWPGVFVLLKPTLAPFALVGIRSRGWWLGLGAIGAVSLILWPLTMDYVTVLRNAGGPEASPLYSVTSFIPLGLLLVATPGSSSRSSRCTTLRRIRGCARSRTSGLAARRPG